jgi:hypothetical protein
MKKARTLNGLVTSYSPQHSEAFTDIKSRKTAAVFSNPTTYALNDGQLAEYLY